MVGQQGKIDPPLPATAAAGGKGATAIYTEKEGAREKRITVLRCGCAQMGLEGEELRKL